MNKVNRAKSSRKERFRIWLKSLKKERSLLLMCAPAIVFFFVFSYLIMPGVYVAFVNYNYSAGIFKSPFIGLQNFRFLMISGELAALLRNTILYNLAFLVTSIVVEVAIAILLNEIRNRFFRRVSQSLMIMPVFISMVIVGLFAYSLLNYDHGIINSLRAYFGRKPIDFYSTASYWPFILTIANLWSGAGYGSVIYFAALMGIDTEILEAAQIDGASTLQRVRYILLPLLRPTVVILTLFSIGGILHGNFGLFYNLVGSSNLQLLGSTDIIETYVYRAMMKDFQFSNASAVGLVQSLFGFALVMLSNKLVKKVEPEYALF